MVDIMETAMYSNYSRTMAGIKYIYKKVELFADTMVKIALECLYIFKDYLIKSA